LLNRILQVCLIAVLVAAPFPFGSVQESWAALWRGVIAALLMLWAVLQISQKRISLVETGLGWSSALLLACTGLTIVRAPLSVLEKLSPAAARLYKSAADAAAASGTTAGGARISVAPFDTASAWLQLACCIVLFFVAVHVLRYQRGFIRAAVAIIGSGTLIALLAIAQNVWSNGKIYWIFESGSGMPFGPFVNHNHFAGYMELVLGLAVGMFAAEASAVRARTGAEGMAGYFEWLWDKAGGPAWMYAVCSLIAAAALAVSQSRGGVVSVVLAAALFSIVLFLIRARGWRTVMAGGLLLTALVALLALSPRVWERWSSGFDESGRYRLAVWRDTIRLTSEFPVTGSGLGTFRSVFPQYRRFSLESETTHAENEYLQWLAETGVTGAVLAVWIGLVFCARVLARLLKRKDPYIRGLAMGTLFGLAAFLIHNAMDFHLHVPSNAMTFVAVSAILLLTVSTHRGERFDQFLLHVSSIPLRSRNGLAAAGGAAAVGAALVAASWLGWTLEHSGKPASLAYWNDRLSIKAAQEQEASAAAMGLLQFRERGELLRSAEENALLAIGLRPSKSSYWATLGRVRAARQKPEPAEAAFLNAARLAPLDGFVQRDYAVFQLRRGRIETGLNRLSLARALAPSLGLRGLLEIAAARTRDPAAWQLLVKREPGDLREYAAFLRQQGFAEEAREADSAADLASQSPTQ
jgi:hypothetical protein